MSVIKSIRSLLLLSMLAVGALAGFGLRDDAALADLAKQIQGQPNDFEK